MTEALRTTTGGLRLAWPAAAAFVLAVIVLEYQPLLTRDGTFPGHDWSDIHQADAQHVQRAVEEGSLFPWWAPDIQGGTALFAVPTKPFAYPPFLAAVVACGPYLGMNVATLAHVALAALGMLLLMHRLGVGALGAAAATALFVAATYPGSLFKAQPFWGYALAWWPFSLLLLLSVLRGARPLRAALGLGLLLAVQLLAGGVFQVYWLALFAAPFAVVELLAREGRARLGVRLASLGLALAIAGALAAVKLLPALRWMATSGRAGALTHEEIFFTYGDMEPFDQGHPALTVLYVMVAVGPRIGVLSLGLGALLGLVLAARRRHAWGALLGTLVCLLVVSGLIHDELYAWLPGYDRMRMPYRFFYPAGLGAILLTGLGLDRLAALAARGGSVPSAVLALLVATGLLWDLKLVPGVAWQAYDSSSIEERQAMARPVLDLVRAAPELRLQYPRAKDQPLWLDLHLRGTSGVVGGGGSENLRYAAWLPYLDGASDLELHHGRVLDVLATGWIGSWEPLDLPHLQPVYEPDPSRPFDVPTNAFVARLSPDGSAVEWCGYLGGSDLACGYAVAVDAAGLVTVVGRSDPPQGGRPSDADAFVALVDPAGRLLEHRSLGGAGSDWLLDVALGPDGQPVAVGRTTSASVDSPPVAEGPDRGWDALVVPPATAPGAVAGLGARRPAFVPVPGDAGAFLVHFRDRMLRADARGLTLLLSAPKGDDQSQERLWWALRMDFAGPSDIVREPAPGPARTSRMHLLIGPPERQAVDLPHHDTLRWTDAWPGVDLELRPTADGLDWRFHCAPGADPQSVRWTVAGCGRADVDDQGRLNLRTPAGDLALSAPLGANSAAWSVEPGDGTGRFRVAWTHGGAAVPAGTALVLSCTTPLEGGLLGGACADFAKSVAVDARGDVYVAGFTDSGWSGLPAPAPGPVLDPALDDPDAFCSKLSGATGELLFTTLLGGDQGDWVQGLAVDDQGRAYLIGSTRSDEGSFPVLVGPTLRFGGVEDAWVARLSPGGERLEYCGYLGGAGGDYGQGIAVGADGAATVCGDTKSNQHSLPVRGGPDLTFNGAADAFVGRISPDGRTIDYLGYIGGTAVDVGYDLALDPTGVVVVAGSTASGDGSFPVRGGPSLTHGGGQWDAFVTRVAPDGSGLLSSGFLGGAAADECRGVAVDGAGRAYLAGTTRSSPDSFPVRDGPGLVLLGDDYTDYLVRERRKSGAKPYLRPWIYRRTSSRAPVCLVDRPMLVSGDAPVRESALRKVLGSRWFDPRTSTHIEDPGVDAVGLDVEGAREWRAVLFAAGATGMADAQARAQALADRLGGAVQVVEGVGAYWAPELDAMARDAPPPRIEPVDAGRVSRSLNSIEVDIAGSDARFLLLSELMTLHPGWEARVDGQQVPLLAADGLVAAVRLPPGARRASFRFRPPGLLVGASVSAVTGLLLLCAWAVDRRRRRTTHGREARR